MPPEVPEHPWQIPGFSQPSGFAEERPPYRNMDFLGVLPAHFSLEPKLNNHVGIQCDEHSQRLKTNPKPAQIIHWSSGKNIFFTPPAPMGSPCSSHQGWNKVHPQIPKGELDPRSLPWVKSHPRTVQEQKFCGKRLTSFNSFISHPKFWGMLRISFYTQLYDTQDDKMQFFPPFFSF